MTRPLAALATLSLFLAAANVAAAATAVVPPIPTYDVADYVVRGQQWAAAAPAEWPALALQVDPHPALHPALLGLVFRVVGYSPAVEHAWMVGLSAAGLLALVGLGAALDGGRGAVAGALAAASTALGLLHEAMVPAPMTEPLAQLCTLVGLAVHVRRPFGVVGTAGVVGALVVAAGATRFNLLPGLLVPLVAAELLDGRRPWRARVVYSAGVLAPGLVVVGAIAGFAPEYVGGVRRFFTNVDSEVATFSLQNLAWFAGAWVRQVFGSVPVAAGALVLAGGSVLLRRRGPVVPGELAVAAFLAVGVASLLVHPFKLDRNLYVLVAPAWLLVWLPWVRVAVTPARVALLAGGAVGGLGGYHGATAGLATEAYYSDDRHALHALESMAEAVRSAERVILVGAHRDLSRQVLTYWLHRAGFAGDILEQPEYPPSCRTERGAMGAECHPGLVATWAAERGTAVVTVAPLSPGGGRHSWTSAAWSEVETTLVPRGYRGPELTLRDAGLKLRVYR